MRIVVLFVAVGFLMGCKPATDIPTEPVVTVDTGRLRGSVEDGLESWKGIPFAAPPVGPLRWRAPQPREPWPGILDATRFRSDCIQLPFGPRAFHMRTTPSEDCLYLNVWRPVGATEKLPVVVWIYGGGWVFGGTSAPIYSGAGLAKRGFVVASLNYRLGHFGFFAHPQLTDEDADDGLFFNYGTLDQIAALQWIRRNIAAFGGDPDNITVMGESAGGVSIHALLTSPMAGDLFDKAIIMSGANGDDLGSGGLADAEGLGINLASRLGIEPDDRRALAKLRAMPAERILDGLAFGSAPHDPPTFNGGGPIEDGRIVAEFGEAYASGRFRRVPLMIGATADDLGGRTGFMVAGARRASGLLASKGAPVFQYRFSYVPPAAIPTTAEHAIDIPFFLQTQASLYGDKLSPADDEMAETVGRYVARFAKTDASDPSLGDWPRFRNPDDKIMDFSRNGTADVVADPWASEIDASAPPRYPGLAAGGARSSSSMSADSASKQ